MNDMPGSDRPLLIEFIRTKAHQPQNATLDAKIDQEMLKAGTDTALLDIKPANDWMKLEQNKPRPRMLFGCLWLEGELCILFADTNMGKSVLAVQLADSISRQQPINGFELEFKPDAVLYIDFELSTKQFETRYSDERGLYRFSDNFYRAEVNLQAQKPDGYKTFTDYMAYNLHRAIKSTGAQVLIIDNITCLGSTEQPGPALAMMTQLKLLKTRHALSILVLAHTPKRRPGKPIGRNDLGGSKMLINFADSAIAMAESGTMPGHRYLKQVKQRGGEEQYGANKVCLFKLEKTGSFIGLSLVETGPEYLHLRQPDQQHRAQLMQAAISLQSQGYTQRHIAAHLGIGKSTVNTMLNDKEAKGSEDLEVGERACCDSAPL